VIILAPISNNNQHQLAIAFVDDNNIYSSSQNFQNKIQQIMNDYIRLYKVMRGLEEQNKSYFCA